MSAKTLAAPIAVRLGLTHISVAPLSGGFAMVAWSAATNGPRPLCGARDYEGAVDQARAYAAIDPLRSILELPDGEGQVDGRGLVHVDRRDDGSLEVMQESASGNSFALLRRFRAPERKRALLFALEMLGEYTNGRNQASRLGRLPS